MSKLDFEAGEFEARRARVRRAMEAAGIDLLLVLAPVNIHYLIGTAAKGYHEFQVLFFPLEPGPLTVLTRLAEVPEFEALSLAEEVCGWGGREPEDPVEAAGRILAEKGYKGLRTGLEVPDYYLHPHHYLGLRELLGDSLVAEPTHLIGNLKIVKSPAEMAYVRKAAGIADAAMTSCVEATREGRTEKEVAGEVHRTLLVEGSDIPASPMNLCSGERSAFAHGAPSERRLERGDFIHAQYGAAYRRYCCTIGRQLCLGEPTARMRELYGIAREAMDACMAEMRSGVPATVPHEAARAVIERAGMDKYRLHMSGYAVGTAYPPSWVEPLLLFSDSPYTLEAGMIIAVEPPLFGLEEGLGVRIIDNVLVTEMGVEVLSSFTSELIVV